jgi:hypothetical protein
MEANRRTVTPEAGGDGWTVAGGTDTETYPTQAAGQAAAEADLMATGGGEVLIKGEDGRIREQNTIGRPDPRGSKG